MANSLRFYPVSPLYWQMVKEKGWRDQLVNLGLYLQTCRHRNLEGLYSMPYLYIHSDRGWPMDEVERMMGELIADDFIRYDNETEVVLLLDALEHNTPVSPTQVRGALNALATVPKTVLWHDFVELARVFAPKLHEALVEGEDIPSTDPMPEGVPNPLEALPEAV